MQWDISQQSNAQLVAFAPCPIQAEDIVFMATIRAYEGAHVLNNTEYWNIHLLEQVDTSNSVSQRQVLRS